MSAKARAKRDGSSGTREEPATNRWRSGEREQKETASNNERTAKDETILDLDAMDISADLERYLEGVEDELKGLLDFLGGGDPD